MPGLEISTSFLILLITIAIWDVIWKLIALWKSARKSQLTWFIILAIINSVGILPILYIYVFSKSKQKIKQEKQVKKKGQSSEK